MQLRIPAFRFRAPGGTLLSARKIQADIRFAKNLLAAFEISGLERVHLLFELDAADWALADAGGYFQNPASARSPTTGGGFGPGPVRVEAELDPSLMASLALLGVEDAWAVGVEITAGSSLPLHDTESWRAWAVTQRAGPVRVGFQTPAGGYSAAGQRGTRTGATPSA